MVKFVTTDGIETISLFNDALNRALHSLLGNEKTMDIVYLHDFFLESSDTKRTFIIFENLA